MSLALIVKNASIRAQRTIAQLHGMEPLQTTNFHYQGKSGIGTFGRAIVDTRDEETGGRRRRAEVVLTVSRDQLFNFQERERLIRLARGQMPAIAYTIQKIDAQGPLFWRLTLISTR